MYCYALLAAHFLVDLHCICGVGVLRGHEPARPASGSQQGASRMHAPSLTRNNRVNQTTCAHAATAAVDWCKGCAVTADNSMLRRPCNSCHITFEFVVHSLVCAYGYCRQVERPTAVTYFSEHGAVAGVTSKPEAQLLTQNCKATPQGCAPVKDAACTPVLSWCQHDTHLHKG